MSQLKAASAVTHEEERLHFESCSSYKDALLSPVVHILKSPFDNSEPHFIPNNHVSIWLV